MVGSLLGLARSLLKISALAQVTNASLLPGVVRWHACAVKVLDVFAYLRRLVEEHLPPSPSP